MWMNLEVKHGTQSIKLHRADVEELLRESDGDDLKI